MAGSRSMLPAGPSETRNAIMDVDPDFLAGDNGDRHCRAVVERCVGGIGAHAWRV
jgi:hypothetical protein